MAAKYATNAPHGVYHRYTMGGCRCELCHAAMLRYNKRRLALIQRGEWKPWMEAESVRRHIRRLRDGGMRLETIASLAGVAPGSIYKLFDAGRTRVRADFAGKLLGVAPDAEPPPRARVDATGTRRRLQALVFMGWSAQLLAERLGMERSFIRKVMDRPQVEGVTARAVQDLFAEMSIVGPPVRTRYEQASATRAQRYARERGWVSALAWDDIDNPKEKPKGLVRGEAS
ncbi:hypothetical protein [Nonomuraea sp. WAC 01424]|uniref:hypothetical protein n=1 Tax=Nonomuraea sp. WAC 01424 TaxID=2203200 RepID=UPI000F7A699C|nr:hypothetical protein [Nonomuraea sp. WAC 01424]